MENRISKIYDIQNGMTKVDDVQMKIANQKFIGTRKPDTFIVTRRIFERNDTFDSDQNIV